MNTEYSLVAVRYMHHAYFHLQLFISSVSAKQKCPYAYKQKVYFRFTAVVSPAQKLQLVGCTAVGRSHIIILMNLPRIPTYKLLFFTFEGTYVPIIVNE